MALAIAALASLRAWRHHGASSASATGGDYFLPTEIWAQQSGNQHYRAVTVATARPIVTGRWLYARIRYDTAGHALRTTVDTLTVAKDEVDGTPAWRAVLRWSPAREHWARADSIWISRDQWRLLRRRVVLGGMDFDAAYVGDTVRITRTRPEGTERYTVNRPESARSVTPVFFNSGGFLFAIQRLPLTDGWRGSIATEGIPVGARSPIARPLDFEVVGTARVTVPAGTFECWRVRLVIPGRLGASDAPLEWLVDRATGLVVRQDFPSYLDAPAAVRAQSVLIGRNE